MQLDGLTAPGGNTKIWFNIPDRQQGAAARKTDRARRSDATLSVESEQHGNEEQA